MAGLSLRKVKTAPSEAMPGRLNSGFINGRSAFSSKSTTPNSTNRRPMAPVMTQTAIKKKQVFNSRSWAVCMTVFNMLAAPILMARPPKRATTMDRQITPLKRCRARLRERIYLLANGMCILRIRIFMTSIQSVYSL